MKAQVSSKVQEEVDDLADVALDVVVLADVALDELVLAGVAC